MSNIRAKEQLHGELRLEGARDMYLLNLKNNCFDFVFGLVNGAALKIDIFVFYTVQFPIKSKLSACIYIFLIFVVYVFLVWQERPWSQFIGETKITLLSFCMLETITKGHSLHFYLVGSINVVVNHLSMRNISAVLFDHIDVMPFTDLL